jgi:hypothetical protein
MWSTCFPLTNLLLNLSDDRPAVETFVTEEFCAERATVRKGMDKEQLRQKLLDAFTDALADVLDEAFPSSPPDWPYKLPMNQIKAPDGWEVIGYDYLRAGKCWLPTTLHAVYGPAAKDESFRRIIVRKVEPKPEPCVVVREKREVEVETTYRKVACRKAKPGEFIGTGLPDNPVTPWALDYESYSEWDIYEPVKEVSK